MKKKYLGFANDDSLITIRQYLVEEVW